MDISKHWFEAYCSNSSDGLIVRWRGVFRYMDMKPKTLFNVEGLTAVVTGGATGIGFAYAEAMADNGAHVTLLDVDADALDRAVAALAARGATARAVVVDVTDSPALESAIAGTAAESGRLDVVFANAGITAGPGFLNVDGERDPAGAIENVPAELWDRVVGTNLTSVFATIRSSVPHMKARRCGRI